MTPSQARIDAALRLADLDIKMADAVANPKDGRVSHDLIDERMAACRAYRAALPKLRSRSEVDAEIAHEVRYYSAMEPPGIGPEPSALIEKLNRLVVEPTAPEEPESSRVGCHLGYLNPGERCICPRCVAVAHNADLRDPDPCGCDQSNDLSRKLSAIEFILKGSG